MAIIEMNAETFNKYVTEGDKPLLVEFWGPDCVYCRRIEAIFAKVADQYEAEINVGKVNVDDEVMLAIKEGVEVVPTLKFYKGGKAVADVIAPQSKSAIENFVKEGLEK